MSVIIIDDQDANVTRSGNWQPNGVQQEFRSTTLSSGTQGSTLQLRFYGSEIRVFGTVGFGSTSNMTFSIDNGRSKTFTAQGNQETPQFHQNLFTSSSLSLSSPHTLVATVANNPGTTNLFVDYFLVTVPATANSTGADDRLGLTQFVDDTNALISYSGSWNGNAGTDQDLQSTLHGASAAGSTATLAFDGTQVTVFGSIQQGSSGALATFTLDGNTGSQFTYSVPSTAPTFTNNVSANTEFFQVNNLADGNHTLVMSSLGSAFFLDYVLVNGFTPPPGSKSGSGSGSGAGSGGGSSSGSGSGDGKHSDTGAIAGGVVGGVLALTLLAGLAFFLVRRRKKARARRRTLDLAEASPGHPDHADATEMRQANGYGSTNAHAAYASSSSAGMLAGFGAGTGAGAGAAAAAHSNPPRSAVTSSGSHYPPSSASPPPSIPDRLISVPAPAPTPGSIPPSGSASASASASRRNLPSPPHTAATTSFTIANPTSARSPTSPYASNASESHYGGDDELAGGGGGTGGRHRATASGGGPRAQVHDSKRGAPANAPAPAVRVHEDSGVRGILPDDGEEPVEELPPQYTAD